MAIISARAIRYLHEAACAINLGQAVADWHLIFGDLGTRFYLWELHMSLRLGLVKIEEGVRPKDLFPSNDFSYWLRVAVLSLVVWFVLRLSARFRLTRWFLFTSAGVTAFLASPSVRLYLEAEAGRAGQDWRLWTAVESYETLLAVAFVLLYLWGRWRIPDRAVILALVLHHAFWFGLRDRFVLGAFAAPMGLVAGVMWLAYRKQVASSSAA